MHIILPEQWHGRLPTETWPILSLSLPAGGGRRTRSVRYGTRSAAAALTCFRCSTLIKSRDRRPIGSTPPHSPPAWLDLTHAFFYLALTSYLCSATYTTMSQ
ncbi:hypothetical protein BO70DRAFT_229581 [Aspergillus heteromorphus CBS 117.55]|uniref:Uncharacterized protein n=1 Tax=Aspergillus heteromorphus CBS 117.55 TaxID=1448321 RepID=A0A317WHW3_9EURO|nr:uncharacterized protein BO70DRAFT_229581 [Aspergillus heteromorphus CBS 117.55]PWY84862.1 hypothetical protein BO70DRAFT_229581 [Aspergillus heteromorphus CBS 117.55]